jgi:hypothetical protein
MWSRFFRLLNQNFVRISHYPHACYIHSPSHSPWSNNQPNNSWWTLQIWSSSLYNFSIFLSLQHS